MKVGIVGCEAAKFTPETQEAARRAIRSLIRTWGPDLVISGHSPLGGIDWWAIEEAEEMCIQTREYPAQVRTWGGPSGYQARNLQIARNSDVVVCITVKCLPPDYRGMRFPQGCYHCLTPPEDHVKSGGCWTMHQAGRLGKRMVLVIIDPEATP